jgi:hypothetical protein
VARTRKLWKVKLNRSLFKEYFGFQRESKEKVIIEPHHLDG